VNAIGERRDRIVLKVLNNVTGRRAAILIRWFMQSKSGPARTIPRTNLSHRIAVLHIYDVFATAHLLETIRLPNVIILYGDDPSLLVSAFFFSFPSPSRRTVYRWNTFACTSVAQWDSGK